MGPAQVENTTNQGHKKGHGPHPGRAYMKIKNALHMAHGTLNRGVKEDGPYIGKENNNGNPVQRPNISFQFLCHNHNSTSEYPVISEQLPVEMLTEK
jgi:hypothetical protein